MDAPVRKACMCATCCMTSRPGSACEACSASCSCCAAASPRLLFFEPCSRAQPSMKQWLPSGRALKARSAGEKPKRKPFCFMIRWGWAQWGYVGQESRLARKRAGLGTAGHLSSVLCRVRHQRQRHQRRQLRGHVALRLLAILQCMQPINPERKAATGADTSEGPRPASAQSWTRQPLTAKRVSEGSEQRDLACCGRLAGQRTGAGLAFLPRGCDWPLRAVLALWQCSPALFTCAGWYMRISATSCSRASTLRTQYIHEIGVATPELVRYHHASPRHPRTGLNSALAMHANP